MEIRKEIESLALWYIPIFLVTLIGTSLYSGFLKSFVETDQLSSGATITFLFMFSQVISNIDNIVVGIWLYFRSKDEDGRAVLWLLFGVVAHFFAALIYICIKI